MNRVSAAVTPPSRSTASMYFSNLAWSWHASASPNSLNHGLGVYLWVHLIKYIFKERQRLYGDTGVTELDRVMGSIYSAHPRVDRHHLISISSFNTMKIHTLSFPNFRLTRSVRDPRNFMYPQGRVVSYLLTFLRSSSLIWKERKERFSYPMNPFRRMVTVGHNARVFV